MDYTYPLMQDNNEYHCKNLGHVKPSTFSSHHFEGPFDCHNIPLDLSLPKSKSLQNIEHNRLSEFPEHRIINNRRSLPDPCANFTKRDCLTDKIGCSRNYKLSVYSQPRTHTVHQPSSPYPYNSQNFTYGSHPNNLYLKSETITYDFENLVEETDYRDEFEKTNRSFRPNAYPHELPRGIEKGPTVIYKHKKLCYIIIIAGVVILGTILAGGISAFFIWLAINSGGVLILESILQASKLTAESAHILVKSLDKFNSIVLTSSGYTSYVMTIALDDLDNWPANAPVKRTSHIAELSILGKFDDMALINILRGTSNLTKLKLENNEQSSMCALEKKQNRRNPATSYHKNVEIISLEIGNFTKDCNSFFRTMNTYLAFNNLKEFVLSDSIFSRDNTMYIQNILRDSKNSLNKIEFRNTHVESPTFSWENIGVMPEVTQVVFDVWTSATQNLSNFMLAYAFPNLAEFSFGHQERIVEDLHLLVGLRQLKQLEISIRLPRQARNFSVAFLQETFPTLENATLFLTFAICPDVVSMKENVKNYLLDLDKLKEPLLSNLYVDSNCQMFDGYEEYTPIE